MIKITKPKQNPSLFASASSLQLSKHHRHSTKLTPLVTQNENQHLVSYPSSNIIVDSNEYQKLQEILQWRINTDFPIVKVRSYQISNANQTIKSNLIEFLIELQSKTKPLSQMDKLQFFQAIYVLKQSIIGFQRLCDYFGFFTPSIDMIRFNENQNCKVWINEDCFSNVANFGNTKSQKQFIFELCRIVESQTLKSKISAEFFDGIKSCKGFIETINLIDNYSKSNKVIIPTKIQNLQAAKQSLMNSSLACKHIFNQSNSNLTQQPKIPEFIKMNKVQKTISYNPSPHGKRKMTACTAQISRDISLTNISRNNSTNSNPINDLQEKKTKKDHEYLFEEDSFLKHLNIRLIGPDGKNKKSNASSTPIKKSSFYEQRSYTPSGQISETFVDEQKRSRFSFFGSQTRGNISHYSTAQRLFLTPNKPTNHEDTYSTSPKKKPLPSPKYTNSLRYLDLDENEQESFDEFSKIKIIQNKFQPLSISQIRQKRKFSVDLAVFPFKMMTQDQKNWQDLSPITHHREQKFPSHQIILIHQNVIESQQELKEQKVHDNIRETIMNKNGWKGLELFVDPSHMKQSVVDADKEFIPRERTKTSDLLKLGSMGRQVKSSMISEIEFELQYGEQLEKQEFVRNELLNLLD